MLNLRIYGHSRKMRTKKLYVLISKIVSDLSIYVYIIIIIYKYCFGQQDQHG